ncbi:MAG: sensor histidine kinase [Sphingomonadales bacterium]|nr:sensor histidine kinase [Sphingomonadales bacterium]
MPDIVAGRISSAGHLISADDALLRLQQRAGGLLGGPLAVPSLAGVARLARTLGILISRSVICADGDHDVELLVRARLDREDVVLSIGGWTPRPQRQPWLVGEDVPALKPEAPEKMVWVTDAKLDIVEASGPENSNITGKSLTEVFRLIEDEFSAMPILAALATGSDFTNQFATMRAHPEYEVSLSGQVLRDDLGNFAGLSGSTDKVPSDITEDPTPEPAAGPAFTERLDAALRAPLGRIVASADSISAQEDGPLRRDYADYAGDIASAARHLLTLVDDLSDLHMLESPDFKVDIEEVDLADLARRAAGLLKVRAADRNIKIDLPGAEDTLLARGDFRRILQILVNLIGNAIRYSPTDGMIWLRIERDADTVVMIVADQGKGIAQEDQARIFEKFERVDPSEPGGSGLGLFISRRLAQAMGGDIVVDSGMGQGARFVLTLPAAD